MAPFQLVTITCTLRILKLNLLFVCLNGWLVDWLVYRMLCVRKSLGIRLDVCLSPSLSLSIGKKQTDVYLKSIRFNKKKCSVQINSWNMHPQERAINKIKCELNKQVRSKTITHIRAHGRTHTFFTPINGIIGLHSARV